jgi:zinc protease
VAAVDRSGPPAPSPIRTFEFPPISKAVLGNGLELRIARVARLPLVSTVLVLPTAESALSEDRGGLAVLSAAALEGGTAGRSATELAEALESIGAALDTDAGWDATTISLTCLPDRLPRALALLGEVVRESVFPEAEVERLRDQRLARIRQRAMDPSSLANDRAARLFYADGVPYGRPVAGTVASVSSQGRSDVTAFAGASYRPRGAAFVMAGDVDEAEASALLEEHLGAWEGAAPARASFDAAARFSSRTVQLVHRPGAVQSELRIGHPGLPRSHPDYFALVVANTVLGGAFTSRLNLNLRERHGFTYGVRSRFSFRRNAGPFSVSTSVGSDVTAPAVSETLAEIEAFTRDGPTEAEVEAARDYIAGVFPLRMETTAQLAAHLAESIVYDLPDDHQQRFRDHIRAVTATAAHEAIARHIRPREITVVVVGDAERVRAPLEGLGLGPLEVHAAQDGQPFAVHDRPVETAP